MGFRALRKNSKDKRKALRKLNINKALLLFRVQEKGQEN